MALSERLALLITANVDDAVKGFQKVGKAAEKELGKAEKRLDKTGTQMTRIGVGAAGLGAVAAVGLYKLGQSASDLNETTSQSEQIFDSAQGKIEDFAKGAAQSLGQSERAARDGANTFGLFFTNAGKSADEAANMSIELTKLASDMASFKNTSPEQAIEAIGAALRGESEPIRTYGVMLDDATLKQRALNMGLIETASGVLPPAIKQQAAYAEILAQTGTIQGDFARTSDGAANQQRILTAELENLKAGIGAGVLPVMTKLLGVTGEVVGVFGSLDESTQGTVGSIASYATVAAVALGGTSALIGQVIKARDNFGKAGASVKTFGQHLRTEIDWARKGESAVGKLGAAAAAVGVAYVGLSAAVDHLSGNMQDIKGDLDAVTSRLRELGTTGRTAGLDVAGIADDIKHLKGESKSLFDTVTTAFGGGRIIEEWADTDAAVKDLQKLDEGLASLVQSGDVDTARAAYRQLRAELVLQGVSIEDVRSSFNDYDAALGTHVRNVRANTAAERDGANATGEMTGKLSPAGEAARRAGEDFQTLRVSQEAASTAGGAFATSLDAAAYNLGVIEENLSAFNDEIDQYLGKAFSVQDATDALQTTFNGFREVVKATKGDLTGTSEAAIAYRDAEQEIVSGAAGVITALAETGASSDTVRAKQRELADQAYVTAIAAGVEASAAENLRIKILGIPTGELKTTFTVDSAAAEAALERLRSKFADVGRAGVGLSGLQLAAVVRANARAEGGPVTKGQPYIVGEKRPELFVPDQNGTILPSVPRAGNRSVQINNTFHITESGSAQLTAEAVVSMIARSERALAGATAAAE